MDETPAIRLFLEELEDRLVRMYATAVRECLTELTDGQIWWRPNSACNSVGNLVLHLSGNVKHYLGRGIAGTGYRRDRPAEFEQGPVSRETLLAGFEEAIAVARSTFEAARPDRLTALADLGGESRPIGAVLVSVTAHFSGHVGQIIYITKMLKEGVFADQLWMRVRDR